MIRKSSSQNPSLAALAYDAIADIAHDMQRADPQLSDAQAVSKAAQTPSGRQAYALSQRPGADKPWLQALAHFAAGDLRVQAKKSAADLLKIRPSAPTKASLSPSGLPTSTRSGAPAANVGPAPASVADVIWHDIREQALAGPNPEQRSEPGRISAFLSTSEGQALWRRFNEAQHHEVGRAS
jgi:hypothetical protein